MAELLLPGENLLLIGMTGSGKTTQLAKLIEAQCTKDQKARVNVTDRGGTTSILAPLVKKGICEIELYTQDEDIHVWLNNVVNGRVKREGQWVDGAPHKLGLWATESLSGCGSQVLNALGKQAADGFNVGGEPAPALKIQAKGETIIVPSGSRSHYLVAQRWLLGRVWDSQALPCPVVWTAQEDIVPLDKKAADGAVSVETVAGLGIRGIIGPLVAGSALTKELPKDFTFTFRLAVKAAEMTKGHRLFTGRHKDGMLEGLANARCDVPLVYDPADLVKVLKDIRGKLG